MEARYGSWASPIDAHRIAEGGVGLGWPQAVGEAAYWAEMRPTEGGRYVIVRRDPGGAVADVTPSGVNARTLVHEYGGGMYVAFRNARGGETVVFSDYADQRLYRQDLEPANAGQRSRWGRPGRRRRRGALERAAPAHAGAAGPARLALRRRGRDARRPPARLRPRASLRRRRGERPRRAPHRRLLRARRRRDRPRLLRRPAARRRRHARRVAELGPAAHALGRHRTVGSGDRRRRPTGGRRTSGRRGDGVRRPAPLDAAGRPSVRERS